MNDALNRFLEGITTSMALNCRSLGLREDEWRFELEQRCLHTVLKCNVEVTPKKLSLMGWPQSGLSLTGLWQAAARFFGSHRVEGWESFVRLFRPSWGKIRIQGFGQSPKAMRNRGRSRQDPCQHYLNSVSWFFWAAAWSACVRSCISAIDSGKCHADRRCARSPRSEYLFFCWVPFRNVSCVFPRSSNSGPLDAWFGMRGKQQRERNGAIQGAGRAQSCQRVDWSSWTLKRKQRRAFFVTPQVSQGGWVWRDACYLASFAKQ